MIAGTIVNKKTVEAELESRVQKWKNIASGFKETYVVDLRYYEPQIGKQFDFEKFINEHHIDKVLILGNNNYFINVKNNFK